MFFKRVAHFVRHHDWFAVGVEILVVIVGLMLAFQLDRWWERQGEHAQEAEYLARLIDDVESDLPVIEYAIELARLRKGMAELLMEVAEDPAAATAHPLRFVAAVKQAAFTYSPNLASHTFEDMRSTGNLRLLKSPAIKAALYDYYNFYRSQNQYRPLQFMTESRHFELVAGVLSYDQERLVQDNWYVVTPGDLERYDAAQLDLDQVQVAADRLRARPAVVAWLPELRHLQIEQIFINESSLQKARDMLELLTEYSESLD